MENNNLEFNTEIKEGKRFGFGKNWDNFLKTINEERIDIAIQSIKDKFPNYNFSQKIFIDFGCGSGLFSLAAIKLGCIVYSIDFDPFSVACTQFLKEKYDSKNQNWEILNGSILDDDFLNTLPHGDIVYSWGVLHHTGNLQKALTNIKKLVKYEGYLFISIYNNQGKKSKFWLCIKKMYNFNFILKYLLLIIFIPYYIVGGFITDFTTFNFTKRYVDYKKNRGMSIYHDWIDWLGGLPFEVATIEYIFNFFKEKFHLIYLKQKNGSGCNEFIFIKKS